MNCNIWYDDSSDGSGNGLWDDNEIYQDLNTNGSWDTGEPLYSISSSPNQIIVNYDTNGDGLVDETDGPPQALPEIDPDEINSAMVYLNGNYVAYHDIIKVEYFEQYKFDDYTPIEEIVIIFSNEIIEDVPEPLISDQYSIAKTYWPTLPDGTDVDGNGIVDRYYDYDYHLFKYDDGPHENLLKLIHPAHYYDPGFWESADDMDEGFFNISDLVQDIMIYVTGINLRQGENVVTFSVDSVDVTGDGVHNHVYDVTKEFEVEYEYVNVPIRKVLGELVDEAHSDYDCSEGQMLICYGDNLMTCPDESQNEWAENECGEKVNEISECSTDSSFAAYKVTRTKSSIMHGSGVEYGERNWIIGGGKESGYRNFRHASSGLGAVV